MQHRELFSTLAAAPVRCPSRDRRPLRQQATCRTRHQCYRCTVRISSPARERCRRNHPQRASLIPCTWPPPSGASTETVAGDGELRCGSVSGRGFSRSMEPSTARRSTSRLMRCRHPVLLLHRKNFFLATPAPTSGHRAVWVGPIIGFVSHWSGAHVIGHYHEFAARVNRYAPCSPACLHPCRGRQMATAFFLLEGRLVLSVEAH